MKEYELKLYEKYNDKANELKNRIGEQLWEYIHPLCDYQEWMERTHNRIYINDFDIGYKTIRCKCSIYVGCNETDEFDFEVPKDFLMLETEERAIFVKLAVEQKQNKKIEEERKALQRKQEELKRQAEILNKNLESINRQLGVT